MAEPNKIEGEDYKLCEAWFEDERKKRIQEMVLFAEDTRE